MDEKKVTKKKETKKGIVRRYSENSAFFSDLFRLEVSKMLQWKGWTKISKNAPKDQKGNLNEDWFYTEHCHYYHTVNSNGKSQDVAQMVGQHTHRVEVTRDPKDYNNILDVKCTSGPLRYEITEQFGKRQRILVEDPNDNHTHDVTYLKSDKLHKPSINVEASKVASRTTAALSKEVFNEEGRSLGKLEVR